MRKSRPVSPTKQLKRLQKRHESLKERVRELECHSFLTLEERMECTRLKKQKLATKDALTRLRESHSSGDPALI